jgi:hypothetical protein
VVIGAEASASVAPSDPLFFNYTDYSTNVLRQAQVGISAEVRAIEWLSIVGEVRMDSSEPRASALFVRVRPWRSQPLTVQAGRIPPVFGAFARRPYLTGNPLIGIPLAYQYLTTLRADAAPATIDDLLRVRGRGWRVNYDVGSPDAAPGLPVVSALRWDTGVQATYARERLQASFAVTNGTLSNPRLGDDNGGKQIAARAAYTSPAITIGVSAAKGPYVSRRLLEALPGPPDQATSGSIPDDQVAIGTDVEVSRAYWVVRGEAMASAWWMPTPDPSGAVRLRAYTGFIEGRYRVSPRFYAAARVDRLTFSSVGTERTGGPWDAPVTRLEAGGGYYVRRNLVLKIIFQHDRRETTRVRTANLPAAQVLFWF